MRHKCPDFLFPTCSSTLQPAMLGIAPKRASHPENHDAICSDPCELAVPKSFHRDESGIQAVQSGAVAFVVIFDPSGSTMSSRLVPDTAAEAAMTGSFARPCPLHRCDPLSSYHRTVTADHQASAPYQVSGCAQVALRREKDDLFFMQHRCGCRVTRRCQRCV